MNDDIPKIIFTPTNEYIVTRNDKVMRRLKKRIKELDDEAWIEKQLNSRLLRSIQSGDSIDDIAKIFSAILGNDMASALRNARTMTTEAENGGRLDSYKDLASQGVVQKKVWIATPDDRTRPSHIDIDGEEQDIDVKFSNDCMYPADGNGPAEEVWQCRCTMGDHIIGFKRSDGSISYVKGNKGETLHDKQMAEEKRKRGV